MQPSIPDNCKKAAACLDYQAYIFAAPQDSRDGQWRNRLIELGRLRHEMLGVSYVDTEWGLIIVPPHGFPEIKVNFFHHVTTDRVETILSEIARRLTNKID